LLNRLLGHFGKPEGARAEKVKAAKERHKAYNLNELKLEIQLKVHELLFNVKDLLENRP